MVGVEAMGVAPGIVCLVEAATSAGDRDADQDAVAALETGGAVLEAVREKGARFWAFETGHRATPLR